MAAGRAWAAISASLLSCVACVQLLDLPEQLTYPSDATHDAASDMFSSDVTGDVALEANTPTVTRKPFPADCTGVPAGSVCVQDWAPVVATASSYDGGFDEDAAIWDDKWLGDPESVCTISTVTDPTSSSVLELFFTGPSPDGVACSLDRGVSGITPATGMRLHMRMFLENLPPPGTNLAELGFDNGALFAVDWEADRFKITLGDEVVRRPMLGPWTEVEAQVAPGFANADLYFDGELVKAGVDLGFVTSELYVSLGMYAYDADLQSATNMRVRYDDVMIFPY